VDADWRPTADLEALQLRAAALKLVRGFFEDRGSLEVQTPCIVPSPGVDAWLDAPSVDLDGRARHLATSPEYAMKRLLAAGSGPIHQVGPAFRSGERGDFHEPEFTMVEWYEPGADDDACMDTTEALVRSVATALGDGRLRSRGEEADVTEPFERITYRQAFQRVTDMDPGDADTRRLGRLLRVSGVRPPRMATPEEMEDLVLGAVVQPTLGVGRPVFVTDWPPDRAALARIRAGRDADRAPSAARFELYAAGVELCNGYHELTSEPEQRSRIQAENERRVANGKEPGPVDERFLAALAHGLPDCAGNALGFDRLLMLIQDASDIGQVLAFRVE